MNIPEDLRYTKSHEWVRRDGDHLIVGITHFAQQQLGDLTFVELPSVGDAFEAESDLAVVESVKAASDIYAPVNGTVSAVNEDLEDEPELINQDPYGKGWMFKLEASAGSEDGLLDAAAYAELAPSES